MLDQQGSRLLDRPGLAGVVCTVRPDGAPQANSVWFRSAGDEIRIWTDERRRWVANLRRAPQVAFSVHQSESPWFSISIRGRADLAQTASGEALEEIRRISARYLPPAEIDAYIDAWPTTRSVVVIQVTAAFAAQAFEDPVAHRRS